MSEHIVEISLEINKDSLIPLEWDRDSYWYMRDWDHNVIDINSKTTCMVMVPNIYWIEGGPEDNIGFYILTEDNKLFNIKHNNCMNVKAMY